MADLTEDDEKLANIFARGLAIYQSQRDEDEAKRLAAEEEAKKGGNNGGGNGGESEPPKSWRERLLG